MPPLAGLTPTSGHPVDLVGRCAGVRDLIAKIGCGDPDGAVLAGAAEVLAIISGISRPHLSGGETTAVFHARDAVQKGRLPAANQEDPIGTLRAWIEKGDVLPVGYRLALARIWEDGARHAAQRRVSDRHKPAEIVAKTRGAVDAAISAHVPVGPKGLASIPKETQNAIVRAIIHDRYEGGMFLAGKAMDAALSRAGGVDRSAHGLAKGGELAKLDVLLTTGVDPAHPFSEAPLWIPDEWRAAMGPAMGTGGGTAYNDGPFIVVAPAGKSVRDGGVDAVLVNDEIADVALPALRDAYPGTRFLKFSQAAELRDPAGNPPKK